MHIWLRFLRLLNPYRGRLLITFVATLTRPLLNACKIYLLKLIVDNLAQTPWGLHIDDNINCVYLSGLY